MGEMMGQMYSSYKGKHYPVYICEIFRQKEKEEIALRKRNESEMIYGPKYKWVFDGKSIFMKRVIDNIDNN